MLDRHRDGRHLILRQTKRSKIPKRSDPRWFLPAIDEILDRREVSSWLRNELERNSHVDLSKTRHSLTYCRRVFEHFDDLENRNEHNGRDVRQVLTRLSSNGKCWRCRSLIDRCVVVVVVVVHAFLVDVRHLDKRKQRNWIHLISETLAKERQGCRMSSGSMSNQSLVHSVSYDLGCSRKDLRFRWCSIGRHRWNGCFDRCLLWSSDSF